MTKFFVKFLAPEIDLQVGNQLTHRKLFYKRFFRQILKCSSTFSHFTNFSLIFLPRNISFLQQSVNAKVKIMISKECRYLTFFFEKLRAGNRLRTGSGFTRVFFCQITKCSSTCSHFTNFSGKLNNFLTKENLFSPHGPSECQSQSRNHDFQRRSISHPTCSEREPFVRPW